jgi:hypothetical protein
MECGLWGWWEQRQEKKRLHFAYIILQLHADYQATATIYYYDLWSYYYDAACAATDWIWDAPEVRPSLLSAANKMAPESVKLLLTVVVYYYKVYHQHGYLDLGHGHQSTIVFSALACSCASFQLELQLQLQLHHSSSTTPAPPLQLHHSSTTLVVGFLPSTFIMVQSHGRRKMIIVVIVPS